MILFPGSQLDKTLEIAEKVRSAIESSNFGEVGRVTCSFGVTQFLSGDNIEIFLKRVDKALYKAKKEGRNRVVSE